MASPMTPTPGRQALLVRTGRISASAVSGLDPANPAVQEGLEAALTRLPQSDRMLLDALEVLPLKSVQVDLDPQDTHDQIRDKVAERVSRAISEELHKVAQKNIDALLSGVKDNSAPPAPALSFFARLGKGLKATGSFAMGSAIAPLTAFYRAGSVATMPMPGDVVKGMGRASEQVTDAVARDLTAVASAFAAPPDVPMVGSMHQELDLLAARLGALAPKYGVKVNVIKGMPAVDWKPGFPTVAVGKSKGFPHELIHGFQMTLGGASALGTRSAEKLVEKGVANPALDQVLSGIKDLKPEEVQEAHSRIVGPAESKGYALYEAGAGLAGPGGGSVTPARYRDVLVENIKAFSGYFKTAKAPALPMTAGLAAYAAVGKTFPGFDKFGQVILGTGALAVAFLPATMIMPAICVAMGVPMLAGAAIGAVRGRAAASKRQLT